jgi:hypothetical protein
LAAAWATIIVSSGAQNKKLLGKICRKFSIGQKFQYSFRDRFCPVKSQEIGKIPVARNFK